MSKCTSTLETYVLQDLSLEKCKKKKMCKFSRYKINIQKSDAFLYTNNGIPESKKMILFKLASKRIKQLRVNLTKVENDLYSENYKTLMKEVEDYTKKWKDILSPCIGRINIVKTSIPPKTVYRFNAIPIP